MKKIEGSFFPEGASISASNNESNSTSASAFKLKKGRKNVHRTTVTYRLNVGTVDRIETLANEANKSINETVQELLDLALDNIEVE